MGSPSGDVTDPLVDGIVARGDLDVTVDRVQQHLHAGADRVCIQVLTADNDLDVVIDRWHMLAEAFNLWGNKPHRRPRKTHPPRIGAASSGGHCMGCRHHPAAGLARLACS